jgi:hypothetical protein
MGIRARGARSIATQPAVNVCANRGPAQQVALRTHALVLLVVRAAGDGRN